MTYYPLTILENTTTKTPSGSLRIAQLTTLFDGKILDADDTNVWETVGSGSGSFTGNTYTMSVTSGQYKIRQSKHILPYFSGKPQMVEVTFKNFGHQANVTKKVGYFSSSAVVPYSASTDGFWVESDGTTYYLKAARNGTETISVAFTDWIGYDQLQDYDFDNFTVFLFDFLWLGGAALRLWVATPTNGFILAHSVEYVLLNSDVMMLTPNQPCRYEIRSSTGNGAFTPICSQIATEGSINESGMSYAHFNSSSLACGATGTIYALLGIKKQIAYRDVATKITGISCINTATSDAGILMLLLNPTISSPLVYSNKSKVQLALATGQTITANTGRALCAVPVGQMGASLTLNEDYLTWLSSKIDNTLDEFVLAYLATTNNQNVNGIINFKEYC